MSSDPEPEPEPDETLNLTDIPGAQQIFEIKRPFNPAEHNAKTRRILGFTSLGVLGGFYAAILACFITNLITLEELSAVIAAFSGLQTLAAAVFGYYFAKDN